MEEREQETMKEESLQKGIKKKKKKVWMYYSQMNEEDSHVGL